MSILTYRLATDIDLRRGSLVMRATKFLGDAYSVQLGVVIAVRVLRMLWCVGLRSPIANAVVRWSAIPSA